MVHVSAVLYNRPQGNIVFVLSIRRRGQAPCMIGTSTWNGHLSYKFIIIYSDKTFFVHCIILSTIISNLVVGLILTCSTQTQWLDKRWIDQLKFCDILPYKCITLCLRYITILIRVFSLFEFSNVFSILENIPQSVINRGCSNCYTGIYATIIKCITIDCVSVDIFFFTFCDIPM